MKRTVAIIIGTGLSAIATIASAGGSQSLAPVTVTQTLQRAVDCTPPNSSSDCAALHAQIRANLSPREIGMLFGAATSYPEYATAYSGIAERYQNVLDGYKTGSQSVAVASR